MADIVVTQHCAERYAERIMDRDGKTDVAVFVSHHMDKITEDIEKMIEYGELIYTGPVKDKNIVKVYVNGTWVIFVDKGGKKVITLYKVDLMLSEDFNKQYMVGMLERIRNAETAYKQTKATVQKKKSEYTNTVNTLNEEANSCRQRLKALETEINGYKDVLKSIDQETEEAEKEYRQSVLDLVGKREF